MSRSERITLLALAALSLALRAVALLRYRFDSDEQQHLHVAWGWTAGLVQYRDYFDNHAPLFHMLTAPLLALLGERSDVLLWMRVPMLALFASVVYCTYVLARRLYDQRIALWSALLLTLFPPFFLKSLEYRIDNLWLACWMAALVIRSPFFAGLLIGAALATSLKTVPLVFAVVVAGVFVSVIGDRRRIGDALRALAGLVIVPLAVALFLAAQGAWDEFVYCNFTFNGGFALTRELLWLRRAAFPFLFAGVLVMAWRMRASARSPRYFFALTAAVFAVTVATLWPLVSPRDFLPVMPLAAVFAAARLARVRRGFAIVCTLFLLALVHYANRFENETDWHITMMNQALRLTRPGEMLMDYKGETIYRRRPFYYAFETVTRAQMARGVIRDTIPEDIVRTRTYVAQADGPMWPPRAKAFLNDHFLDMGRLRAAGQWLKEDGSFSIVIPGEYVIVSERGEVRSPRVYGGGSHRFEGARGERLAVLWAPAFRRGHSPFHLRDREF